MTEPRVEAGGRALETAILVLQHINECIHYNRAVTRTEVAALIQSAMNAQEREIARIKKLFHDLTPGGSEFVNDPDYCAAYLKERSHMQHEIAKNATIRAQKAERLLAERGEAV